MRKISKKEKQRRAEIITGEDHGIFPPFEVLYLTSILYHTKLCLQAFMWYENNKEGGNATSLMGVLQNAMAHAAAISRFFWPSTPKEPTPITRLRKARGEKLRQAFDLTGSSPLNNRNLRNTFEHFDERLDIFLIETDAGYFLPEPIIDSSKNINIPTIKIFKLIDKEENCITLLGKKFEFLSIKDEVSTIQEKTINMIQGSGRLPN